jgi:raffinose/stachyose/melibiose transport system substrate-binding protein
VIKALAYGDESNQDGMNWIRIVKGFEATNPDIDIQYEMLYDEAYYNQVVYSLASGDVPDLAYMGAYGGWGQVWEDAGQRFDMKPYIDPNYYDLSLIPPMGPNGEIYEIPLGTSNICTVLYMNRPLVESLGFTKPNTYEDIAAMAWSANALGLDVITIDGADGWAWGSCLMSCFAARLSGDSKWVSKAASGINRFTDKGFVNSLSLVTRMIDDGVISANATTVDYGTNISNFNTGKALFMVQGQWAAVNTDVIDAYLCGIRNDVLNTGMQDIARGTVMPADIAEQVESTSCN